MMEAVWSASREAHQVNRPDLTLRRCWNQWTEETSFTQRPGSETLDRSVVEKTVISYDTHAATPNIDPCHNYSPVLRPRHPSDACVATHSMIPRSQLSTRKRSVVHRNDLTRVPPPHYQTFLAFSIP
ncbi:hypothetical protein TNCV_2150281 [Trichonephila clavipes]|nr:hypothetical protein TNCV_2150281 [Trichonephila clavipes]